MFIEGTTIELADTDSCIVVAEDGTATVHIPSEAQESSVGISVITMLAIALSDEDIMDQLVTKLEERMAAQELDNPAEVLDTDSMNH